jgi:hypothetical protein
MGKCRYATENHENSEYLKKFNITLSKKSGGAK